MGDLLKDNNDAILFERIKSLGKDTIKPLVGRPTQIRTFHYNKQHKYICIPVKTLDEEMLLEEIALELYRNGINNIKIER